ncbi:MAG: YlbF family regulator [Clostridiales bacterium]|jgi:cell fate (sporulation/competence/biofilm development) regulator YlbF (YheA/YmcA/DUF963 family)|nr:YlbF family regulator [Clostridiales bacterium]
MSSAYENEILSAAESLGSLLKNSLLYSQYMNAYNLLTREELSQLKSFKDLDAQIKTQENLSFEFEKQISNVYAQLTLNKRLNDFITAELELCSLIKDVYEKISLPIITFD